MERENYPNPSCYVIEQFCFPTRLLGGPEVREPVARLCGALRVVEHALERLDVADGVAQDLYLGKPLVRHLRSLLPQDLESLIHLPCFKIGFDYLLLYLVWAGILNGH